MDNTTPSPESAQPKTLEELKAFESAVYQRMREIEQEILEPAREKWRAAYRAVEQAKEAEKIEAEVQRRLAEKETK